MPIEIAALAATVVSSFLFPYAKKAVEKVAEVVTEKFGEAAAKHGADLTGKVWARIKAAFTSDKEKNALENFEEMPDETRALIEAILKKKLAEDPALHADLEKFVAAPSPVPGMTGAQVMHAGIVGIVDLRGATISGSGGVFTGVNLGSIGGASPGQPAGGPTLPPKTL